MMPAADCRCGFDVRCFGRSVSPPVGRLARTQKQMLCNSGERRLANLSLSLSLSVSLTMNPFVLSLLLLLSSSSSSLLLLARRVYYCFSVDRASVLPPWPGPFHFPVRQAPSERAGRLVVAFFVGTFCMRACVRACVCPSARPFVSVPSVPSVRCYGATVGATHAPLHSDNNHRSRPYCTYVRTYSIEYGNITRFAAMDCFWLLLRLLTLTVFVHRWRCRAHTYYMLLCVRLRTCMHAHVYIRVYVCTCVYECVCRQNAAGLCELHKAFQLLHNSQ